MSKFTDQQYLKDNQYRDAANLNARFEIHRRFSVNPYGWYEWVFDVLSKLPAGAVILELGCGPAYLWKSCVERIPAGWNITLSDLSAGMIDAAWRNLVVTRRSFKFEEIDAQSIPYPDERFDAVIANHMLYHLPDRPKALSEIKRVLKPGGRLIATTLGESHMKEMGDWIKRARKDPTVEPFALPFSLENGWTQLAEFFSRVELMRYDDVLQVTEVDPIIDYLCSGFQGSELMDTEVEKIRRELEVRLKQDQLIVITKDSGLFEAIK